MMEMAKVTSKGQITIPISIRNRLEIKEGDKILFINKQDGVLMVNPDTVQGDLAELKASAVPLDAVAATPAPHAAASPSAQTAKPATPAAADKPAPSPFASSSAASVAAPIDPPRRKFIPPVEEPLESRPVAKAGDLDLSTLLDDIRSIGSNI